MDMLEYLLQYVAPTGVRRCERSDDSSDGGQFYVVTAENGLPAFKRACRLRGQFPATAQVIVSLRVSRGASIYAPAGTLAKLRLRNAARPGWCYLNGPVGFAKLRASRAEVVSMATTSGRRVEDACGLYDRRFRYARGVVVPEHPFSRRYLMCDSGIHFFLTLREAGAWV